MRRATFLSLFASALLAGCGAETPEAASAVLTISVSPVPLVVRWACPQHAPTDPPPTQCFLSMDPTVTVKESAGVGGRVVSMAVGIRDGVTGADYTTVGLDRNWILDNAGTDRIEGNATLSFRVVVNGYPLPYSPRPNLRLAIGARVVDDRGNELTPGLQVNIN